MAVDDEPAEPAGERPRMGRAPSTTPAEISHAALRLFMDRGFDATTIDDIAREAGIGRRTFFRYFSSKNDLPWGEFDDLLDRMRAHLAGMPADLPMMEQLRRSIVEFNRVPDEEREYHRRRMALLLHVPTLLAHSTLRYASWRQVVAEHVARRLGLPESDLIPQTMAWTCLGVCLAAYEQWLLEEDGDLLDLLDEAFRLIDERIDTEVLRAHRGVTG
ncbi:mycofactocin system transcriptional regulator [Agromyces aerolatus]|uniref:mycofactocin system transcriptional regulator n=1 Tax=Agromyces sp. LY-1074 TaxID=3074080 RepID=UPI002867377A|nr:MULTISPECIES: mycofactocin system transcriptional regulator [unclassified Agromyces]MDR5700470.1 mycofactocin system transcriptional regulator [Agromyces sp. LY-1074]MDR5706991.1 mycofactocin system transcriptional regulator [Agromyces sp. LY-1358]